MSKKSFEIESFMTQSLGLSGNELVLYAIMWKETGKGEKPVTLDYNGWSEAMGVKVPTVYNCLNKLVERGIIDQECKSIYRLKTK
jgi:predicted transcriptional regulator